MFKKYTTTERGVRGAVVLALLPAEMWLWGRVLSVFDVDITRWDSFFLTLLVGFIAGHISRSIRYELVQDA